MTLIPTSPHPLIISSIPPHYFPHQGVFPHFRSGLESQVVARRHDEQAFPVGAGLRSGAPGGDIDEACAQAALDKFEERFEFAE